MQTQLKTLPRAALSADGESAGMVEEMSIVASGAGPNDAADELIESLRTDQGSAEIRRVDKAEGSTEFLTTYRDLSLFGDAAALQAQIQKQFGAGRYKVVFKQRTKYVRGFTLDIAPPPKDVNEVGRPPAQNELGDQTIALLAEMIREMRDDRRVFIEAMRGLRQAPAPAAPPAPLSEIVTTLAKLDDLRSRNVPDAPQDNTFSKLRDMLKLAKEIGGTGSSEGGLLPMVERIFDKLAPSIERWADTLPAAPRSPTNPQPVKDQRTMPNMYQTHVSQLIEHAVAGTPPAHLVDKIIDNTPPAFLEQILSDPVTQLSVFDPRAKQQNISAWITALADLVTKALEEEDAENVDAKPAKPGAG